MIWKTFAIVLLLAATPAWTQARPAITGLAYVQFFESDLPQARHFYGERLGLPETDNPDGSAIFAVGTHQQVRIAPLPSPVPSSRIDRVAFFTADVPAMRRFLEAHGVKVESAGGELRLQDPVGTRVAFVQAGPANPASKVSQAGAPTARRMIHTGWRVGDRAAEDAFYKDLLGFRPYWFGGSQPGSTDWVSLQVPEGTDWIEYMLHFHADADRREAGVLDHISLGVERITQATDRLIANGWTDPTTRKSQIGKDGKWQLNVFDPDQTRVEFMEFKPVETACCSAYTATHPAIEKEP